LLNYTAFQTETKIKYKERNKTGKMNQERTKKQQEKELRETT
jgi:hypothetical protein